jgi:hypothetical protein
MAERQWRTPKSDGIRKHTGTLTNQKIDRATQHALDEVAHSPDAIRARLAELEREWNVDRALMLNFAVLGGLSAGIAIFGPRRARTPSAAVLFTQLAFLAHHAIRRWCPPMPVFRRLGFRTEREIDAERAGLEKRLAVLTDGRTGGPHSGPVGAT